MRIIEDLESISDGKLYDIRDMVKADAGGCNTCSACCHGVGELVELTPFDLYEIQKGTQLPFEALLLDKITLRDEGKLQLPYLKMIGDSERCSFLNDDDRCSIHGYRPSICRLFPLGRVYIEGDLKYFLQVGACTKPTLEKVKVKKWIGIEDYNKNKRFILAWHDFIKALKFRMKFIRDDQELREINDYLIEGFYKMDGIHKADFYRIFDERLADSKRKLGLI